MFKVAKRAGERAPVVVVASHSPRTEFRHHRTDRAMSLLVIGDQNVTASIPPWLPESISCLVSKLAEEKALVVVSHLLRTEVRRHRADRASSLLVVLANPRMALSMDRK